MFIMRLVKFLNNEVSACTSTLCGLKPLTSDCSEYLISQVFFLLLALYDVTERGYP